MDFDSSQLLPPEEEKQTVAHFHSRQKNTVQWPSGKLLEPSSACLINPFHHKAKTSELLTQKQISR